MDNPLVSCILLLGVAQRTRLAYKALRQFQWQAYPSKQLVIVNTTGVPVLQQPHPELVEVHVDPCSIAAMRNIGLAHAKGDWHVQWDDDDCYHPFRLWYQMSQRQPGQAVVLANQVRFNYKTGTAFIYHNAAGIPNTAIYPRSDAILYEDSSNEDHIFYGKNWSNRATVIDNLRYPVNCLSVAVYHGHNVKPLEQFMAHRCRPEDERNWYLGVEETAYLREALSIFGVPITIKEETSK